MKSIEILSNNKPQTSTSSNRYRDDRKFTRVSNYSGGYENVFPYNTIEPSMQPFQFDAGVPIYQETFKYRYGREMFDLKSYFILDILNF